MPDFEKTLRYVIESGYKNNEILSNSLNFSPAVFEFLKPQEGAIFKLITSIDAGCAQTYQKIKKVDGFYQVCANLKKYASTGGDVIVKYIFTHENNNITDVQGFINFVVDAKIKHVLLDINRVYELSLYPKFKKLFRYMQRELIKNDIDYWMGAFGVADSDFIKEEQKYKKFLYKSRYKIAKLKYMINFTKNRKNLKEKQRYYKEKYRYLT